MSNQGSPQYRKASKICWIRHFIYTLFFCTIRVYIYIMFYRLHRYNNVHRRRPWAKILYFITFQTPYCVFDNYMNQKLVYRLNKFSWFFPIFHFWKNKCTLNYSLKHIFHIYNKKEKFHQNQQQPKIVGRGREMYIASVKYAVFTSFQCIYFLKNNI